MMAAGLTLDVSTNMSVDKKTVERALKIVEWYCNDNGMCVVRQPHYDGSFKLALEQDIKPDDK